MQRRHGPAAVWGTATPSGENPPTCDADCPVVANLAGSKTKTLRLVAKGSVKTFVVDGSPVAVHVSTYNRTLPGPTVEIKPGETQRRRMLNAGPDAPIHVSLDRAGGGAPLGFYPIGFDGIPTPDIRPRLTRGGRVGPIARGASGWPGRGWWRSRPAGSERRDAGHRAGD